MKKILKEIANDTLKRDDGKGGRRWSRTSLTMLASFVLASAGYVVSLCTEGFRLDAFTALLCVGTGMKIADSYSKKIDKTVKDV